MNLGVFEFPRPHRGYTPYPWLECDPGDVFEVSAKDLARARNSLRACANQARRMLEWRPVFEIERRGGNLWVWRVE